MTDERFLSHSNTNANLPCTCWNQTHSSLSGRWSLSHVLSSFRPHLSTQNKLRALWLLNDTFLLKSITCLIDFTAEMSIKILTTEGTLPLTDQSAPLTVDVFQTEIMRLWEAKTALCKCHLASVMPEGRPCLFPSHEYKNILFKMANETCAFLSHMTQRDQTQETSGKERRLRLRINMP